jgi:hypothetical protein
MSNDINAWTGHSLQLLLSHPLLETQFLEDAVKNTYSQGLDQFDENYESSVDF